MLKKIINNITVTLALLGVFAVPFAPAIVGAQTKADICRGVGLTGGTSDCAEPSNGPSVDSTVKLVVGILSFIVGIVAVIMIIIGGLKYITSAGDANSISSAKNTILYAIIGLVIVALAQVIVRFVLNKAA